MLNPIPTSTNEPLFNALTPEEQAKINGGVDTSTNKDSDKSSTTISVNQGRAKITVDLRKGLPDKNYSGKYGECRPYFDPVTGEFNFSCALRDASLGKGELFPDE
jgi:hypothetical protein